MEFKNDVMFILDKLLPTIKIIVLCAAMALLTTACDDDDDANIQPIETAYVSLYQASPDAPDLDIVVDNRRINTYPFNYTDHTGYLRFYTGERNLKFGPYGASNVVTDTTVTFEDGNAYSVFVVDEYSNLSVLVLDDNAESPAEGSTLVRFINLSPDAPTVDLLVAGETEPMFADQSFKETSGFMEVAADQYDFEVTGSEDGEVLLDVPDINLQAGWYYTVIVRGYTSPPAGNDNVLSAEVIVN